MVFDKRITVLISIGASVAANCQPCLKYHVSRAREVGLTEKEVQEAAEVGRSVRSGAANQLDRMIERLGEPSPDSQPCCESSCGC